MYLKEKKRKRKKETDRKLNYPYLHRSGVSFRVRLSLSLTPHSQLPWPVPGSEIVGSAKLGKRDHENKTGGNCGAWNRLQLPQMENLLTPFPPWIVLGVRSQTLSYTSMECRLYQKYFLPYVNLYIKYIKHFAL